MVRHPPVARYRVRDHLLVGGLAAGSDYQLEEDPGSLPARLPRAALEGRPEDLLEVRLGREGVGGEGVGDLAGDRGHHRVDRGDVDLWIALQGFGAGLEGRAANPVEVTVVPPVAVPEMALWYRSSAVKPSAASPPPCALPPSPPRVGPPALSKVKMV